MASRNATDLEQIRKDLERVRRDRRSGPGITTAGYIKSGGETSALSGDDDAQFSKAVPFVQPLQAYGVADSPLPNHLVQNFPTLDVTDWRWITLQMVYTPPAVAAASAAIVPLYGYDQNTLFPLAFPQSTVTLTDKYFGARVVLAEQYRTTPVVLPAVPVVMNFRFDVTQFAAFALAVYETNITITCEDEAPCSRVTFQYSLSM